MKKLVLMTIAGCLIAGCSGSDNADQKTETKDTLKKKESIVSECLDDEKYRQIFKSIKSGGLNSTTVKGIEGCYEKCKNEADCTLDQMKAEGWQVVDQDNAPSRTIEPEEMKLGAVICECQYQEYTFER